MEREYTLQEAEAELKVPRVTLRRWLEDGKIRGRQIAKKTRMVWVIPESQIQDLQCKQKEKQGKGLYSQLYEEWVRNMASGYHTGKPLRKPSIENYQYGLQNYWRYLGQSPSVEAINPNNLRLALSKVGEENERLNELVHLISKTPITQKDFKKLTGVSAFNVISREQIESAIVALNNYNQQQHPPLEAQHIGWEKKAIRQHCRFAKKQKIYAAVKSFYKLLIDKDLKTEYEESQLKKYRPERSSPARRLALRLNQIETILEANRAWVNGREDFDVEMTQTLLALGLYAGLRNKDLRSLDMEDVDLTNGILKIKEGKGGKPREVGIEPELAEQLHRWLSLRPSSPHTNFLLQASGRPLTREVVSSRIRRLSRHTGIDIDAHGLRRTAGRRWEGLKGLTWSEIKDMMGHADIATTQIYVESDKLRAIEKLKGTSRQQEPAASPSVPAPAHHQPMPVYTEGFLQKMLESEDW